MEDAQLTAWLERLETPAEEPTDVAGMDLTDYYALLEETEFR